MAEETESTPQIPENFYNEQHIYTRTVDAPQPVLPKNNMFIKQSTDINMSVAYCIDLLYNKQYPYIKLVAAANNADKAIFIAETLKRKVKNLHQVNTLETYTYTEKYTPKKPTEERFEFTITNQNANLAIKLMRVQPSNIKCYGYQAPLQIGLVSTKDPREYIKHVLELKREPKKKQLMSYRRQNNKTGYNEVDDDSFSDYNYDTNKDSGKHHKSKDKNNYNHDKVFKPKKGFSGGLTHKKSYSKANDYNGYVNYKPKVYKFRAEREDDKYYNGDKSSERYSRYNNNYNTKEKIDRRFDYENEDFDESSFYYENDQKYFNKYKNNNYYNKRGGYSRQRGYKKYDKHYESDYVRKYDDLEYVPKKSE